MAFLEVVVWGSNVWHLWSWCVCVCGGWGWGCGGVGGGGGWEGGNVWVFEEQINVSASQNNYWT